MCASLLVLPCGAEPVKFAKDRYSLDIPATWRKPDGDTGKALLVRQNKDGTALFAVSRLEVKEGTKADLDATTKDLAAKYKKDMGLEEDPKIETGEVDGLDSRFVVVATPKAKQKADPESPATLVYLVLIDAKTEVIILQVTLAMPVVKETSEACLAIIQSFKRE
jgi:hypothetical protein